MISPCAAAKREARQLRRCARCSTMQWRPPEKVALRHLGVALTYREVGRAVAALANRLAPIVKPGEVVALLLPNSIEFQIAYFATLKVLAAPALLNPLYPAAQLSPLLREASPRAVVCSPATREMVTSLADDLSIPGVVCLGQETIRELVADADAEAGAPLGPRTATPADPGALLFSGGTTGLPKAIEQTHGRLVTGCAAFSVRGSRAPRVRFFSLSHRSPTSTASSWACWFRCPPVEKL
jgi:long-chain acyl-CoA synthetase